MYKYFVKFKLSKKLGFEMGLSAYPVIFASSLDNISVSQLPLKPVCPVINTF